MHTAPEEQSKKSLFIPSGEPSATCTVCYTSLLTSSRWELLFKGRAFLEDRVQVGQIALENSQAPRGINTLIIPCGSGWQRKFTGAWERKCGGELGRVSRDKELEEALEVKVEATVRRERGLACRQLCQRLCSLKLSHGPGSRDFQGTF